MNYLFCLLLLANISFDLLAQDSTEFAPIGAKWWYSYTEWALPNSDVGYELIESTKDTIILGRNCKKLVRTHYRAIGDTTDLGFEILCQDSQKVLHYVNGQFYTLYDWAANTGDSWIMRTPFEVYNETIEPDSLITVFVDSTSTMLIGMDTLKILYLTLNPMTYNFGTNYIIQKIGSLGYLFSGYWGIWPFSLKLRCYTDSNFNYSITSSPCDTLYFTVGVNTQVANNQPIMLYPNTLNEILYIDMEYKEILEDITIQLYNLNGQLIFTRLIRVNKTNEIKLTNIKEGVYFIKIVGDNTYFSSKIIKK